MSSFQSTSPDVFDFDYWKDLSELDAAAYEERRTEMLEALIASAPEGQQRRLRGIQFELDSKRNMSESALESCMQMSTRMWASFDSMRTNLSVLARPESVTADDWEAVQKPTASAQVISFPR